MIPAAARTMLAVAAHAFGGIYISGSNKKMLDDATNVVLVRAGTRTVLSMPNDDRGPLQSTTFRLDLKMMWRTARPGAARRRRPPADRCR